MKTAESKLTEMQKRFVDFYIQTGNATEAARRAGYSEKTAKITAKANMDNPLIQAAIQKRLKELESDRVATAREVLEFLTSVMRGEIDEELTFVFGTGKGFSKIDKTRSRLLGKDRIKAAELLAKINGMFITKQELEITGNVPVVIHDDI